ncbi:hypothetical protein RIF29_15152 [Crotalaria pallida]|uniref:Leucine-rich repeat-containing N-terminal plant-type domain-containing protein n=1 Tax=Crotalaria pallida TaxID=3830 RepID=A0AAN9FIH1_CROPI
MDASLSHYATIFAWLLCSIILLMFNSGTCNEKDKHALLNFKQGVIDPSGVLSTWTTQQDCCQWEGVACDNVTNRVTMLNLPCDPPLPTYRDKADKSNCVSGSIHLSFLFQLEFLSYLDLRGNDFLSIQFDYSVDSHNSSTLQYLDLSYNEDLVIDNLQWLSRVSSLEYLRLSAINLSKVTNWLQLVTTIPSLSHLHLLSCQLQDISPTLQYANFTALEDLNLGQNKFDSELPRWLFNLSCHIYSIDLHANFFRGQLPKALPNFPYLESLVLGENYLDGQIQDWFGQLEYLQVLQLYQNMFSGFIPISLGNSSSLIALDVANNPLTGVVSEKNFAKLSKLQILGILSKTFIFKFDSHWVPPFQLKQLVIGHLGPKLPDWIYTQRFIKVLTMVNCKVSSTEAQDRFWNFVSRVEFLGLKDNSIGGDLSNFVLNSTFISMLSNNLAGGLPQLSSNVIFLEMPNNSLSGSISPLLCGHRMLNGKSNLKYLDISNNHLTGGLTNCWNNWKSLVHINLGSNNLTGKIPQSMGLLSNLTSLHLHENNLLGEIPSSLQNCWSLLVLNVRENKLSGNVPNWIPQGATVLQLRSNQFNGDIPPQICQLSSLIILDFGDNRISGHIPNCLNNMTALVFNNATFSKLSFYFFYNSTYYYVEDNLELVTKGQQLKYVDSIHFLSFVDLSSNSLSGAIPPQMFSLSGLHSLNLSHNNLMGGIPKEIGNMKNLESLDFSMNKLAGEIPQSMSDLSFLSYLNLSFNSFVGKIPSGTQLQGFSELSYTGNPGLCGPPLTKTCSTNPISEDTKHEDKGISEFMSWFCIGIESGFVTGFLGVCFAIFLNSKWRHAYFKFLYDLKDRVCHRGLGIFFNKTVGVFNSTPRVTECVCVIE